MAWRRSILRLLPRAAIFATSIAELASGDVLYGAFCLVALGITLIPAIHARHLDTGVPLGIELTLLWLMLADMTLGNALGMYRLAWFDKAVHLSSSLLVGMLGFLAIYVMHQVHKTRFHPWLDGIAIFLVTLGIGAFWEIAEFAVDQLFDRVTQGAPNMSPLDDTMFDLLADAIGGVAGAVIGPFYIQRADHTRSQIRRLSAQLSSAS
jgi:hypothetical protein